MTIDEIIARQGVPPSALLGPIKLHGDIKPDADNELFRLYPKHNKANYYYVIRKSDTISVEPWSDDQLKHAGIFGATRYTVAIPHDATIARVKVEVFSAAKPPQGRPIVPSTTQAGKAGCSCSAPRSPRDVQTCCDGNGNCWHCDDDPNICCQDSNLGCCWCNQC
jgi:hypothetical protein